MDRKYETLDGKIELAPPSPDGLRDAAATVLGTADETTLDDSGARLFKGMDGGIFYQPPTESLGVIIDESPDAVKRLVVEMAAVVRDAKAEAEAARLADPATNPLIMK